MYLRNGLTVFCCNLRSGCDIQTKWPGWHSNKLNINLVNMFKRRLRLKIGEPCFITNIPFHFIHHKSTAKMRICGMLVVVTWVCILFWPLFTKWSFQDTCTNLSSETWYIIMIQFLRLRLKWHDCALVCIIWMHFKCFGIFTLPTRTYK